MSSIIRFASYEVDLGTGQLHKGGVKIHLRDQCFKVLASLLERPGEVVSREELQRRLWHEDVFVDFENNLNTAVARLREALCDSFDHPRFIQTLPRRGYRFVAPISQTPAIPAVSASRPRLAVLPFLNLSGDPAQEYFSDAITDQIITALATIAPKQLAVIARTTAMHYKNSHKDVASIGRELNVEYVVEGGVRRINDHLIVNVQLVETTGQVHLFARRYEEKLGALFQIESGIAQAIAAHIPALADKARRANVARRPTDNLAAYNEYIKGRYEMWKWTPESVAKAKQYFEAALACDPRFALACDALANLYGYLGFWGFLPPDETEPIRRFYAQRAFELDPDSAEIRTLLAYRPEKSNYGDAYSYNWIEAEKQMAEARDLNPNSTLVRWRHATVLLVLQRAEEAVAEIETALEFDPLSLEVRFWLAEALFLGRQYERALAEAQKMLAFEPGYYIAYMVLGQVYLGMKIFEESIASFRRAVDISGEFPLMLGWLGIALGLGGHTVEARSVLERLHTIANQRFVLPSSVAWVHIGLGEIDEAFGWIERAVDHNDEWVHVLNCYPFADPLRADPRFPRILRKLNLES